MPGAALRDTIQTRLLWISMVTDTAPTMKIRFAEGGPSHRLKGCSNAACLEITCNPWCRCKNQPDAAMRMVLQMNNPSDPQLCHFDFIASVRGGG